VFFEQLGPGTRICSAVQGDNFVKSECSSQFHRRLLLDYVLSQLNETGIFEEILCEEENAGIWTKLDTKFKENGVLLNTLTSPHIDMPYLRKQKDGKKLNSVAFSLQANYTASVV
jgi:hypothetical protein